MPGRLRPSRRMTFFLLTAALVGALLAAVPTARAGAAEADAKPVFVDGMAQPGAKSITLT